MAIKKSRGSRWLWLDNQTGWLYKTSTAMHRFIINPGTDNAWEIPLREGIISLGRSSENSFPLEHPSVSSQHCQITVADSGVVIKDLGSENGTLVNGALVDEARLAHGQSVQLGDVVMQFESVPASPAKPVATATESASASQFCRYHPKSLSYFFCPKCHKSFCESCVSTRREGVFCRTCSVACTPIDQRSFATEPEQSFARQARAAFAYPLQGDGLMLLVSGTIFFLLIDAATYLARFAFIYGLMAFIFLTVFGTGYLTAYLREILTSSARGDKKMPDWPDITDFGSDVVSPFFQLVGTVLFCFAPAIALTIYALSIKEGAPWLGWASTASIFFGAVYFPMAFMAVAMFDSVAAVNPLLIIPSILKIPKEYLLTILLLLAILVGRWFGKVILPGLLPVPVLPTLFASFSGLYLLSVEMRILGLLYLNKQDELGWFNP